MLFFSPLRDVFLNIDETIYIKFTYICITLCGVLNTLLNNLLKRTPLPTQPSLWFLLHQSLFSLGSCFPRSLPCFWELFPQPLWATSRLCSFLCSHSVHVVSTQRSSKSTCAIPQFQRLNDLSSVGVWLSPSTQWHWIRNKETWGIPWRSRG